MEDVTGNEIKQERAKAPGVGVPYPIESVDEMLSIAKMLVDEYGSSRPISKEEISKTLNKKINSLGLLFSTFGQYNILSVVHGKGYLPTDLYRKYTEPVHDNDELKAKLQMFQSAPLYAKIIEQLDGHQLPADEKRFANLLKGEPYNVNANSAEKAAKVFFENCRSLNLRDGGGKFKFHNAASVTSANATAVKQDPAPPSLPSSQALVKLPIHLPGDDNRLAYFEYPKSLSKRDFKVIAKALTFVASSLITDDENEDYELRIEVREFKGSGE